MSKILVVGASGTIGTELVRQLRSKGHTVLRSTSKTNLDPDQVHLDLRTKAGLESAFVGIDRAFFLCPPGYVNQHELLIPLIDEARKQSLKKVVLMTAIGANAVDSTPFRRAEIHLEQSGLTYNIIRPNWFMQNFNSYWLHGILHEAKVALPVGDAKASFIDARDIANVAAVLLDDEVGFKNQDFDLTGPKAINHAQAASHISQMADKSIRFEDISAQAMRTTLLGAGLPSDYTEFFLMILDYLKQGGAEKVTDAVHTITGKAPITFETYAQDHRQAWL
nr:NAD(P)H-binding protein [uncultured Undibacterium sp.]